MAATILLPGEPTLIAADQNAVWVSDGMRFLWKIDARTNTITKTATFAVVSNALMRALTVAHGSVWAAISP